MSIFRSERFAAILLVAAAAAGLVLANTAVGPDLLGFVDLHLGIPGLGFDLTLRHWVTDGLLAVFFFIAAIELKHELTHGELNSVGKALVPAMAAVGGVVAPALVYLVVTRDPALSMGWPIPTATDIAFALGVLAIVGRGLPSRVRALLLALAVIDDLIAIVIIAFFFTDGLKPLPLVGAVVVIAAFAVLSRRATIGPWVITGLVALGVLAWALVYLSGVHSTIAGVSLGLVMAARPAGRARHGLEPFSNGIILPVFAFVAALVPLPSVGITNLSPAFWAIVIALPVGKLIGITGGAALAARFTRGTPALPLADLVAIAGLGGIGFTVSLLMNELAWGENVTLANEGTLAVITGSLIAAVVGAALIGARARHYRRRVPVTD
ncbi:Na+/H+ antiporter NhaA [Glaciihabitans sp. dw_435]|uniref:Na+/H+ antiporter NhaA n=1 Tax=Glaciihabitans sp. dw_435 TaxID=2720081 RepID=UPI001BD26127|nr:Na+/H+ antiporter NhaA [Glaciihabitans sp. dw_435]